MIRSLTTNLRRLFSTDKSKITTTVTAAATSNVIESCSSNTTPVYTSNSIRTGALGIKKGMMSYWDTWGKRHPVTILHVKNESILCSCNPYLFFSFFC